MVKALTLKSKNENLHLVVSPQLGQVSASYSGSYYHPEVPEDVCGKEALQAEAGCCSGHADNPQSLHGSAEVSGGKIRYTAESAGSIISFSVKKKK